MASTETPEKDPKQQNAVRQKFIYGAYGTGNLGDDLLLKAALAEHGRGGHESELRIVSYGRPRLNKPVEWLDHDAFIAEPKRYVTGETSVHFAGGGLFWAASHCDDMLKVARAQHGAGGLVHIERIGAQGFHMNPDAVRELFDICTTATVRDEMSARLLRNHNITTKAIPLEDYVLTLDKQEFVPATSPAKIPIIAINHSSTPFYRDKDHKLKTLRIYKQLAKKFEGTVKFVYFPHARHFRCVDQNDIITGEEFWCFSGGLIEPLAFPDTVETALRTFGTFSGAIGWRYHLLVLAKLFEIPAAFLGQPGDHKYGAFAGENRIPQINFNLDEVTILSSATRFVNRILQGI